VSAVRCHCVNILRGRWFEFERRKQEEEMGAKTVSRVKARKHCSQCTYTNCSIFSTDLMYRWPLLDVSLPALEVLLTGRITIHRQNLFENLSRLRSSKSRSTVTFIPRPPTGPPKQTFHTVDSSKLALHNNVVCISPTVSVGRSND
jgi:hypothetical protein